MQKRLPVLDTNIIIRYLTEDDVKQAQKVELLLKKTSTQKFEIPDVVIVEIVYVLLSFYNLTKDEVVEEINVLVDFNKFKTNKKVIKKTLEFFKNNNISFIDSYVSALVFYKKNEFLYTFYKTLLKIRGIKAISP